MKFFVGMLNWIYDGIYDGFRIYGRCHWMHCDQLHESPAKDAPTAALSRAELDPRATVREQDRPGR